MSSLYKLKTTQPNGLRDWEKEVYLAMLDSNWAGKDIPKIIFVQSIWDVNQISGIEKIWNRLSSLLWDDSLKKWMATHSNILTWRITWTHLCPTLDESMDCGLPGKHFGILQVRILEWVAINFSRGLSQPTDQTYVSCIAGRFFTTWAT